MSGFIKLLYGKISSGSHQGRVEDQVDSVEQQVGNIRRARADNNDEEKYGSSHLEVACGKAFERDSFAMFCFSVYLTPYYKIVSDIIHLRLPEPTLFNLGCVSHHNYCIQELASLL